MGQRRRRWLPPPSADSQQPVIQRLIVATPGRGGSAIAAVGLRAGTAPTHRQLAGCDEARPAADFRRDLGRALTISHRQRAAQRLLGTSGPPPQVRSGHWFAFTLLTLVGLIWLWLWLWHLSRSGRPGGD